MTRSTPTLRLLASLALLATLASARADDGAPAPAPDPHLDDAGVIRGVTFVFRLGKRQLRPDALDDVAALAAFLQAHPELARVEVRNHENRSCEHCARRLTHDRARTIVDALVAHGVAPERLLARGYGDSVPLQPPWSRLGRALNTRTELVVLPPPDAPPPPVAAPSAAPAPAPPRPDGPAACRASAACAEDGRCAWDAAQARCVPDAAGCQASRACREEGLCALRAGYCLATAASCRRAARCRALGHCGLSDDVCAPTAPAHCRRSEACRRDERCVLDGDWCVQGP